MEDSDNVKKHKEYVKSTCNISPSANQTKYDEMRKGIDFRTYLRSIPKLFWDYNINKRNNMKMRGKE